MHQQPDIIVSPKALEYLHKRQITDLTLELKPLYSCCVPYSPPPQISFTPPRLSADFFTLHQNGISIYVDHALSDVGRMTIDKHGFSFFSWLSVSDWRPMPPSS